MTFERISEEEAMNSVKRLLKELYETGIVEEVPILTSVKSNLKNGIAVETCKSCIVVVFDVF